MVMLRLSASRSKVSVLLLLCCVSAWVVYVRLSPHVEIFARHVGFNILEPDADVPLTRLKDVYHGDFRDPMSSLCPDHGVNVDLLVLVASAPRHIDYRMAIRRTWGQYHRRRKIVVGFMIGVQSDHEVSRMIAEENTINSDVIINNNIDSYFNMTLKTTAILEWTLTYCSKAVRVLKADDDMFINIPRLMDLIRELPKDGRYIYGRLREDVRPERYRFSKYFLSDRVYVRPIFPAFTTGGAYLTTPEVARMIYWAAFNLTYLPLEDVFFTGVVAQQVGVTRVGVPEITNQGYYYRRNPCLVHQAITFHLDLVEHLYMLWGYQLDKRRWCVDN